MTRESIKKWYNNWMTPARLTLGEKDSYDIDVEMLIEFEAHIINSIPESDWAKEKPDRSFFRQLVSLINEYGKDNEANTPDYVLAEYLIKCLTSFMQTLERRNEHINNKS